MKKLILLPLLLWLVLMINPVLAAGPHPQTDGQEYIVQADDWLSKLADKFYGDVFMWPVIWQATKAKAEEDTSFAHIADPNLIEIGWKLWVPDAAEAAQMMAEYEAGNTSQATEHADADHGGAPHWGYGGEIGPSTWGSLDSAFALCDTGLSQSPIDITGAVSQDLVDIQFNYQPTQLNILNNGHTIQANYDQGSYMEVDGVRYDLLQFHFHTPSEHTIEGQFSALEMHLVHRDANDNLAVVGVMINEGTANAALQPIWDNLPQEEGPVQSVAVPVNVADLLPADRTTYRYSGSLTTPPCSEGVAWHVMTTPVEASAGQVAMFQSIFEHNNRPVQPLNDRTITIDVTAN